MLALTAQAEQRHARGTISSDGDHQDPVDDEAVVKGWDDCATLIRASDMHGGPHRPDRRDATRCDAARCDATRCDSTRCDATRRDATRRDATQRVAMQRDATHRDATQCDATQCDATQCDATQRDTTRRDTRCFICVLRSAHQNHAMLSG